MKGLFNPKGPVDALFQTRVGHRVTDLLAAGKDDGFLLAEPLFHGLCREDVELPRGGVEDVGHRRVCCGEEAEDVAVGAAAGVVIGGVCLRNILRVVF